MKRIELEIEHRLKDRFLSRHVLRDPSSMTTIGSSRNASIRLLGEEVAPLHASIEFENGNWVISDLSSATGTKQSGHQFIEHELDKVTDITIGDHILIITPKAFETSLFGENHIPEASENSNTQFHQVVVKKTGFITETLKLSPTQNYYYTFDGRVYELKAPTTSKWEKQKFGEVEILQRLASTQAMNYSGSDKVKSFMDPSLKKPMLGAMALLFLFSLTILVHKFQTPEEKVAEAPKDNKYTKVIFNASATRKRKAQAQQSQKKISMKKVAPTSAGAKNIKTTSPSKKPTKAVVQVVNKLKASGLQKLIGKIAKRASKTSTLIKATGRVAGSGSSGRALSSLGKTNLAAMAGKTGKSFKVAGVATAGVGGGKKGFSGISGLSAGGVGGADVGILEDETVVEGGLEREVIARTIQKYLGEIRYCYERQLAASPELYGKVMLQFTIGPGGQVMTKGVGASTMNNSMVEGCMLRKLGRWKFPKPKGGTVVSVSYPFLFKSTQ